tara:strand:+ start:1780 stop:2574 length:795 start_codon:yes stop_codon:yes gene_type:complete
MINYLNKKIIFKISCLLLMIIQFTYSQDGKFNFKNKNVLIVYGGYPPHQPKKFAKKIEKWLTENNAKVTLSESTEIYANNKIMDKTDLIVQSVTMLEIKRNEIKGLARAISNGAGLAGFHGGLGDSFRNSTEYQYIVGGQFVAHPGGHVLYNVTIIDKNDYITKNINDFNLNTEQYYMHVDPNNKVLATTKFSGDNDYWIKDAIIPVIWKKQFGKGRVFYCSLGHSMDVFDIIEVEEILKRGLFWASESKFKPEEKLLSPLYSN